MSQPQGTFSTAGGEHVSLAADSVETLSVPARSGRVFLWGVAVFVTVVTMGAHVGVAVTDDEVAMFGPSFWLVAGTLLLCYVIFGWCLATGRTRMRATVDDGIRPAMLGFISTHIPWEAVSEVKAGPIGGGVQFGWRLQGGGIVGYLAGEQAVHIKTDPAFRDRLRRGETRYQQRKLAVEYWISVPEAESVAAKLKQLQAQATG